MSPQLRKHLEGFRTELILFRMGHVFMFDYFDWNLLALIFTNAVKNMVPILQHRKGYTLYNHQTFQVPKMEVLTYIQAICKAYVREKLLQNSRIRFSTSTLGT